MNKSRSLLLLSVLAVLFAACEEGIIDNAILSQDYTEPEYSIALSPGELSFPAEGGEEDITLELTRSLSWTATTNDSWITLPTHSGDDSPTSVIHILVAENTSLENRIGTITFKTRGKTATLTVRQEGVEPFLSTDVQTLTFPSDGGAQQVQISTNGNWTATTKSESAFSVSPASGTGEGTLTVTAAENETTVLRWETLTLTSGALTVSITLLQQAKPDLNGHAYVNLALPSGLLWATCNVGASTPEEYGDYFAWGETAKKNSYTWANYKWSDGGMQSLTKYNNRNDYGIVDNLSELLPSDDAAVVNWGGCWRMPTYAEWEELCNTDNCTWTPINNNGHCKGYKVTSTRNGNSIFLPAAGLYIESGFDRAGLSGYFWASTLFSAPDQGCGLYFDDAGHPHAFSRYQGLSVRPVGKMTLHFSLMPTSVNFPAAGSSETLSITANQPWTVTTSDAWLTLSADAGTGDATLDVAAEENTSITRRTGAVTFQTGATTYTVTVSQEGATPTFSVFPESLSFSAEGGSASVAISSNQSWTATTSDAWFSISSAEGEGDATLSLTVVANTSTDSRSGTVTLKAGDSSYTVSISQEGEDPILTISPESLSFSADGGNKSITVTSNLSWTATSSDAWLTVSSSSGEGDATLSVTADENVSIANRTASVTFEGKDRTVTVNVTQDGAAPFFNVTPTTLSFSAEGGSAPVKIESNQTWTASKSADWIALSEVEGTGDATLSLTVDANTSTDSRSGTVAFQAGETYYHINLTQDGEGILFSITPESLSFTAEGGNETITVTSNLSWTVTSSDAWLTLSNSSGEGDATLTVVAQENTSTSSRSGILTFKGKDITFTVNVTQEGASPNFSVTPTTLSFTSSGGSQSVSIKSNQAWTASFDVSWLSLSTASGTGDAIVSITAQANTSTDNRAGTVTFTSGGKTYTVTVIQDGAATHFEITPTTITFTSKGESKSISIMSNQPWTVSSDASWLKLSDNSGTGDATLSVTAEENTSTSSRSSTIIFKAGGKDYTVSVMQEGATPFFNVSPESLSFSSSSESKSITVTSNLSWAASSDVSWLTLSNSSGLGKATLTLTTEANTSTNSRSGTVTFSAGGKTYTVSVSQAGADPTFSVTPTTLSFTASAGSKSVSITSNTSWTASSDGSWLTLSKSAGEGNATLSLTVEENTSISSRTGTVTFKSSGKDYTVSVTQTGADPTFSITPTTLSFTSSGGNQSITVTSNQTWTASSSVSWLTLSKTSGTGDATLTLTAQANTSTDNRSGIVTFTADGKTYTVTASQNGVATYFEITPTTLSFTSSGGSKSVSVMSNQPWMVSADASWLKLSDNSGTSDATLSVTAEENTSTSSRSGTITFKAGGNTYSVSVTQEEANPTFSVTPEALSFTASGGNQSVSVTSNQTWTASAADAWITLSETSGTGDATLTITAQANKSAGNRTGTITFNAGGTSKTVNVTQEGVEVAKAYLTFEAIENTTFTFSQNNLQYSLDGGATWTTLTAGTASPILQAGERIMWKASGLTPDSGTGIGTFSSTGRFKVEGNVMSLLFGNNFVGRTSLESYDYAFSFLFQNCTYLEDAHNLIFPATTLAERCYYWMFFGCTSLTSAPELPATMLAMQCYAYMFYGCTSLFTAPELPATTLAVECYSNMFNGCTSFSTAPKLPGTTLAMGCYNWMFYRCSSLTTAPNLPATTLAYACYSGMFAHCTNLTTVPGLPATTLATICYESMFAGCTSLTTAPELPATMLTEGCYESMFKNCTGLTTAPELPATTLATTCYAHLFEGCTRLNYIKCLATDISATGCTSIWVKGVASSGTFVKNASMTGWTTGDSGIPSGWTVKDFPEGGNTEEHEYVDLGLPSGTLWATCNVGASSPEEYGDYFAWGETEPKSDFSWEKYKFRVSGDTWSNIVLSKYVTDSSYGTLDNKDVLDPSDDAATMNWGSIWRMPTDDDWTELRNAQNCTWEWTTKNGVYGSMVTSIRNGNSVFLPAGGWRNGSSLSDSNLGRVGCYWSSTLTIGPYSAYTMYFLGGGTTISPLHGGTNRPFGLSVRPVFKP